MALPKPRTRTYNIEYERLYITAILAARLPLWVKSLPILHVSADSGTENFHGLHNESQSMAIDCAKDMDDSALIAKYQNKAIPGSGGVSAVRSR
jgi:hypothetical protein